jgi:hypothetical protein
MSERPEHDQPDDTGEHVPDAETAEDEHEPSDAGEAADVAEGHS